MDQLWDALFEHLRSRAEYFRLFDRYRLRPDAWLKIEAMAALSGAQPPPKELRHDRQGCDLWFSAEGGEWWLAIKGLITSYAGNAREARQTLISVEEVAKELDRLRGLSTLSGGSPALLLAAFPFGSEPRELNEWDTQLLRFEAKGFTPLRTQTVDLRQGRECRVYLFA